MICGRVQRYLRRIFYRIGFMFTEGWVHRQLWWHIINIWDIAKQCENWFLSKLTSLTVTHAISCHSLFQRWSLHSCSCWSSRIERLPWLSYHLLKNGNGLIGRLPSSRNWWQAKRVGRKGMRKIFKLCHCHSDQKWCTKQLQSYMRMFVRTGLHKQNGNWNEGCHHSRNHPGQNLITRAHLPSSHALLFKFWFLNNVFAHLTLCYVFLTSLSLI